MSLRPELEADRAIMQARVALDEAATHLGHVDRLLPGLRSRLLDALAELNFAATTLHSAVAAIGRPSATDEPSAGVVMVRPAQPAGAVPTEDV